MSNSKNVRKYKYLDTHKIAESLVNEGARLIYCREALYPIIEAQVRIREKSRDQLGDIEKAILAILDTCPASPDSICQLMGVVGGKLFPIILELEGRGLIEQKQKGVFEVSKLGQLSIKYGVEVVEVDRALLLCGITGKLLPRNLYLVQRIAPSELKQKVRNLDLVPEKDNIELSALDLAKIHDRRAVNLTDEAMEIIGMLDYKPVFLWGVLVFYQDQFLQERGEVIFPGETINWLPIEKIRAFIDEPLGYSVKKSEQEVLEEIESILRSKGVELSQGINFDQYRNPVVDVISVNEDVLNIDFKGKPFLLYFGSDRHKPVPIGQFPFGGEKGFQRKKNDYIEGDLLWGRTIIFKAVGPALKEQIDLLRCMDHCLSEYYRKPPAERIKKPFNFILENLEKCGFDLNIAMEFGKKYGPKNLKKILSTEDD